MKIKRLQSRFFLVLFLAVLGSTVFCQRQHNRQQRVANPSAIEPDFVKVACNCVPMALDPILGVSCCIQDPPKESELGELTISVFARREPVYQIREEFCSDYSADYVIVEGFNHRWVALSHEGFECVEVIVIDVEHHRLALNTGCWNSQYWRVKELPDTAGCEIELTESEGGHRKTYNLCERGSNL